MKEPGNFTRDKRRLPLCLPLALAAMAFVVTGCPHNQYLVRLEPQGNHIRRTLVFYREDGVNTNTGVPNYQTFDAAELAAITSLYPAPGPTNEGGRYTVRGEFSGVLPADVGGAGAYTNLITSLGTAGFYVERFRGNDDLTGMMERRFQAADRLADLVVGWSRAELGREPGYDRLQRFLDVDFRRDLKNLGAYWWEGQLVNGYQTNASEEFIVRFGQYLSERGYISIGELPVLFQDEAGNSSQATWHRIQRLVARQMGVPDTRPVPAALGFLDDEAAAEKSFNRYLATTDVYHARLKQWEQERQRDSAAQPPDPAAVASEIMADLIEFDLFGQPDHLTVRLSLPSPPARSNGRWDEARKEVVWETDIEGRTNTSHFPFVCYASWAQADAEFQKAHFGRVILTGDDLIEYCLWRNGQDQPAGGAWDDFMAGLEPGGGLKEKLDAFRFPGETVSAETNNRTNIASPSAWPRELLKAGLK